MLGFYFSPMGRISRKQFWLNFVLVVIGISIVVALIDMFAFPGVFVSGETGPAEAVMNVVLFWPQIALTTKRFHDRGMSGWWQVLFNVFIIAGAGLILFGAGVGSLSVNDEPLTQPNELVTPEALPLLVGGVALVLVVAIVELVILGFLPGTKGPNKYGEDPLNPTRSVAEVFS